MYLKSITLCGFRSFKLNQTFFFNTAPGFYMLTGENRVQPELGANAVGKSSLWDGLCWCLYGKTSRGLRGKQIENWEGVDHTSVHVELLHKHLVYEITRTHRPSTLTLREGAEGTPRVVSQAEIDELVGVTYEGFLHTTLMGQFNKLFFDLSPTDKLAVFTEMLGLQKWLEAAEQASRQAREADTALRAHEAQTAAAYTRLTLGRERVKKLTDEICTRTLEGSKPIKALESEIERAVAARQELRQKQKQADDAYERFAATVADLREQMSQADDKVQASHDELVKLRAERATCSGTIERLEAQISRAKKLDGDCPTCGQRVKIAATEKLADSLRQEVEWVEMEAKHLADAIRKAKATRATAEAEVNRLGKALAAAHRAREDAKATLAGLDEQSHAYGERIRQAKNDIESITASSRHLQQQLADERAGVEQAKHALGELEVVEQELKAKLNAGEYWAKRFKDLRLWVVQQCLTQLEVHTNNSLTQLGLHGWEVRFEVERVTQAGGVSRGFNVTIKSPESAERVPWESWCGGETQRLRIAGAIGLSNLIRAFTGYRLDLEVWDEPTQYITQEGIDDLMDYLQSRTRRLGRQVWVVDHRSLAYGGFDAVVRVVKTGRGSLIEKRGVSRGK